MSSLSSDAAVTGQLPMTTDVPAMEFGSMLLTTAGLGTHTLGLSLAALTLVASQATLRTVKVRFAAGASAGKELVVGQRRNRTAIRKIR